MRVEEGLLESAMHQNCLIRTIRLRDILSFGSEGSEVELRPLNVLIGPNASGKSNLIEALSLLQAAPSDLTGPIRDGGGVAEWLWKGGKAKPTAEIEAVVSYPDGPMPLRYRLCFTAVGQRFKIVDEAVENERQTHPDHNDVCFFYRYLNGIPAINARTKTNAPGGSEVDRELRLLNPDSLSPEQSVLSQRKDPDQYPEVTYLGKIFGQIKLYREWSFGRYSSPRQPQKTDLPEDFLLEDASNLGAVLNDLEHRGTTKETILQHLRKLYDLAHDYSTKIHGGTVQIYFAEKGLNERIPATRLSDGTLRYLSLLAVLCHPSPPPLICIEEPELGLHPDILPTVAKLLIEASARTQVIVTTHSDILVSALSETPESVLVCERGEGGTELHRLEPERLKKWLDKYSLGELWQMGEIGGARW